MNISIVGNSLPALVLAKKISEKKIKLNLYYQKNLDISKSTRTIGITEENINFLKKSFPELLKYGFPIKSISIYDEKNLKKEILNFHSNSINQFYMFKSSDIKRVIQKNIRQTKFIKCLKRNLKNIYSDFFLNKNDLIIDTFLNNNTAKKFFFKKIKKNYFSKAYTTIIKHEKIINNNAIQIFTKFGPLAFLPISNSKTSVVFSSNKNNMELKDLKAFIIKYNTKYKILKFEEFESSDLSMSLLKNYYHQNIIAFGDKIHKIHPLAGQGFNMCLRDTKELMNIINEKIDLGLPINYEIAKKFEHKVKSKNLIFASSLDFILEFFFLENKLPAKITNRFFSLLQKSKFIKNYSSRIANKGL